MSNTMTKKQVLNEFKNAKDSDVFCAFCYEKMEAVKGDNKKKMIYCPNEMCLNDDQEEID